MEQYIQEHCGLISVYDFRVSETAASPPRSPTVPRGLESPGRQAAEAQSKPWFEEPPSAEEMRDPDRNKTRHRISTIYFWQAENKMRRP